MYKSRIYAALLTCVVVLCARPARAVDQDFDGLSGLEEFNLGLNDNDRDTDDDGLIDGLEFDKTAILSVNISNPFPSSGDSKRPAITADGQRVFYDSNRIDLVAGDRNNDSDIFAVDLVSGINRLVSTNAAGVQCNRGAWDASVSADGRFVVFASFCTNLVAQPVPAQYVQVYLKDLNTGVVELISKGATGDPGRGHSQSANISRDGRYVVFTSYATNLVLNPSGPSRSDIYLYDRNLAQLRLVSTSPSNARANNHSFNPVFSANGQFIAFDSNASNLVVSDTNQARDAFVYGLADRLTQRVSLTSFGEQQNGHSTFPRLSADGRYVTFTSWAAFSPLDTNSKLDSYLRDRFTGKTELNSLDRNQRSIEQHSIGGDVSSNGRYVVFRSQVRSMTGDALPASRFPPTPSSIPTDVDFFAYSKDRKTGITSLVAKPYRADAGHHFIENLSISDEGVVAFHASGTSDAWVEGERSPGVDIYVAKTNYADRNEDQVAE